MRMSRRWVIGGVAALVVVGGFAYSKSGLSYWTRLEREAASLSTPPGMTRILEAREGTTFCFISCNGPRIYVILRTRADPDTGCRTLRQEIEKSIAMTRRARSVDGGCPYEADLEAVGRNAQVNVIYWTFRTFSAEPFPPDWFADVEPPKRGEALFAVILWSGLA
jgi:hypothetical protein